MAAFYDWRDHQCRREQGRRNHGSANGRRQGGARRQSAKWNLRRAGGLQILEAPALARLDWLVHGFSTRPGGTSELKIRAMAGILAKQSLISDSRTGTRASVFATIARNSSGRLVRAKCASSHCGRFIPTSFTLWRPSSENTAAGVASESLRKATLLITRERGVLLVVQTADCIPILLADPKRHAIAAIHSGWRGTVHRIAEKALGRMQMEFGTRPEDVIAALGPGIGQSCYEVGTEVAAEFHAQFPNAREWFEGPFDQLADSDNDPNWLPWLTMKPPGHAPPSPRVHLDLIAANRAILEDAGYPAAEYCFIRILHRVPQRSLLQLPQRTHHRPHDGRHRHPLEVRQFSSVATTTLSRPGHLLRDLPLAPALGHRGEICASFGVAAPISISASCPHAAITSCPRE